MRRLFSEEGLPLVIWTVGCTVTGLLFLVFASAVWEVYGK